MGAKEDLDKKRGELAKAEDDARQLRHEVQMLEDVVDFKPIVIDGYARSYCYVEPDHGYGDRVQTAFEFVGYGPDGWTSKIDLKGGTFPRGVAQRFADRALTDINKPVVRVTIDLRNRN